MPCDMAMERPDTRVVRVPLYNLIGAGLVNTFCTVIDRYETHKVAKSWQKVDIPTLGILGVNDCPIPSPRTNSQYRSSHFSQLWSPEFRVSAGHSRLMPM